MNDRQKTLALVGMVCIALIMGFYGTSGGINPFFSGSIVDNNPSPSPSTYPTYPAYTILPRYTPLPTSTLPPRSTPTPLPDYIYLYMSPNPATQRDNVLGEIWSNLPNAEVTVHYIDGIEYNTLVNLDGSGQGSFHIMLKTGSYPFWVTYGILSSNTVTLVVSP